LLKITCKQIDEKLVGHYILDEFVIDDENDDNNGDGNNDDYDFDDDGDHDDDYVDDSEVL